MPWQPNFGKNKPELQKFQFCARNREIFRMNSTVFWAGDFKYAIRNSNGAKGVAMATKFRQNKPKLLIFQFRARNRGIFRMYSTGLVNLNMLLEFSREHRELPWQPKLGKNKPKLHIFQFCTRYGTNVCVYSRVFGIGEFK